MSSGDAQRYRLSPRGVADLDDIWRYSAETWSVEQADRVIDELTQMFEMIAAMPTLARERVEFAQPVRIHVHKSHLIVYCLAEGHIAIVRLLGGQQDWATILATADL